jgi:hypothetical protein
MGKRNHDIDVDEIIDSINLYKGLRAALLELTPDELAALLADLANSANLPNATFKKARVDLPSFSVVKWSEFAEEYGLHENAWRWQDVYREKLDLGEETRVRLLEPVCQLNSDYMRCTD